MQLVQFSKQACVLLSCILEEMEGNGRKIYVV